MPCFLKCFCKGHLHLSVLGENSEFSLKAFFQHLKNQTTTKMHIYTTKISKGHQQVMNLRTMSSKLDGSPKLTFYFAISAPFFSFKSSSSRTLSATALSKGSLEAHRKNVEGEVSRKDC